MVSQVEQLGADSIYCLSKSIIMENTKLPEDADPKRLKYVCVVVQYAGVKLHKEKLGAAAKAIEVARGLEPMGRKSYNFRLVSQEVQNIIRAENCKIVASNHHLFHQYRNLLRH